MNHVFHISTYVYSHLCTYTSAHALLFLARRWVLLHRCCRCFKREWDQQGSPTSHCEDCPPSQEISPNIWNDSFQLGKAMAPRHQFSTSQLGPAILVPEQTFWTTSALGKTIEDQFVGGALKSVVFESA